MADNLQDKDIDVLDEISEEEAKAQKQLSDAIVAERFLQSETGRLWTEKVSKHITRITRDVTSDKYRKDHVGYNNALADLQAYKRILREMQLLGNPEYIKRLGKKLGKYEEDE